MTTRVTAREAAALGIAPANKYGAKATVVDGVWFASQAEARHYGELLYWQKSGEIRDLERQVRYPIIINGVKVCTYVADFVYWHIPTNTSVVVDVKGFRTPSYRIKARLMRACWGITILEVPA